MFMAELMHGHRVLLELQRNISAQLSFGLHLILFCYATTSHELLNSRNDVFFILDGAGINSVCFNFFHLDLLVFHELLLSEKERSTEFRSGQEGRKIHRLSACKGAG